MQQNAPRRISSVSDMHELLGLPRPVHPQISLINFGDVTESCRNLKGRFMYGFWSVCIKQVSEGKMRYGQQDYDFSAGVMSFFAPDQVMSTGENGPMASEGYWLLFHPDFVRNYPLEKKIPDFGFFSYSLNESLHLSDKEKEMVITQFLSIKQEYETTIDNLSQDLLVSQLELLLNYSNRFYNRQFITRKHANHDLLTRLNTVLDEYFRSQNGSELGLPSVQYLSRRLNVSAGYLGDMLRLHTGMSTQQHVQGRVIEEAKRILSTTSLSVSEVAYQLGFQYPQSFSKLFRNKTSQSPQEFRAAFN